ncbi:fatty-acid amide hydrolase 2 [Odontomachus brunneus]|uniref:fatty-acid amide hydrolase 2 n=1 Tax=Odontomachus brunneus TaxID=486640 RepID=UPI0013F20DE2|nr:fatty-acid amide hydrolase 2 [Odontomachus brunneus]
MCTSLQNQNDSKSKNILELIKEFFCRIFNYAIILLHVYFDYFVDFVFGIYYDKKIKKVPPVKNPLLLESSVSLAEKIRTRQVTSEDVVKAYIKRCKEVNSLINAIVEERYLDAINEAKAVDIMIEKGIDIEAIKLKQPFLGVPFTTKESIEAIGMIHTMGIVSRRNYRSIKDATVVGYLKDAGGILIAKTNVPELNLWVESRNKVYGQTNNPYNTTRTVGGSSGGEGAIIAACGAPISISSDIGGSIRMPAFYNGLFGLKPSEKLTPMTGVGLREKDYPDTMATAGPICKKAEDLTPHLKVLIGANVSMLKLDDPVNLENLKVFYQEYCSDLRVSKVNQSMRMTLKKAVRHFKSLTGSATMIKIPGSEHSFQLWKYWMTCENFNFRLEITGREYITNAKRELYKYITGSSEITFAAVVKLMDEDFLPKISAKWAESVTEKAKKFLVNKLGDDGVLLYPSAPFPAFYHHSSYLRPFNFSYWCLFNVLRFPVCQVPMGLDEYGLPVGIQVVAAPYNDHLCIAVAKELEKEFGGWVPPS